MDNNRGFSKNKYDTTPDNYQYRNRYYFGSDELNALEKWRDKPFDVYQLLLSTAQNPASAGGLAGAKVIQGPGRGFMLNGYTTATQYDPVANTGIETVVTSVFVHVRINVDDPAFGFNLKHGCGYVGDFNRLFLYWPAQANNSAKIYVMKFDGEPFMSGAAPT